MTPRQHRHSAPHRQRGVTLVIGLLMLLVITLIAANIFQLSTLHTRIVNNDQLRTEASSAAHSALDIFLSTEVTTWRSFEAGERVHVNLGNLAGVEAGSTESVAVVLEALHCKRSRTIKNAELVQGPAGAQYVAEADSHCFGGGGTPLTIVDTSAAGTSNDDSLCASVLYEVVARTDDPKLLQAQASITQGVEVRRGLDALNECD
jgi:Tfp pilus assembly protein PilX